MRCHRAKRRSDPPPERRRPPRVPVQTWGALVGIAIACPRNPPRRAARSAVAAPPHGLPGFPSFRGPALACQFRQRRHTGPGAGLSERSVPMQTLRRRDPQDSAPIAETARTIGRLLRVLFIFERYRCPSPRSQSTGRSRPPVPPWSKWPATPRAQIAQSTLEATRRWHSPYRANSGTCREPCRE